VHEMSLSKAEVLHVAKLARLELTPAEQEDYPEQLNAILGFVTKLNEVETTGIEPTAHPIAVQNVFRPDLVGRSLDAEAALANAPERVENFFKVPKSISED